MRATVFLVLALAALTYLCGCATVGLALRAADTSSPDDVPDDYLLPDRASLIKAINTQYAPKPTVVLFTSKTATGGFAGASRRQVRQLARDVPGDVVAIHEYQYDETSSADAALMQVVLPGKAAPVVALYGSRLVRAFSFPGSLVTTAPLFFPDFYEGYISNYTRLRLWALSAVGSQYADPVTYRLMPSVQFAFSLGQVLHIVQETTRAVHETQTLSRLPDGVFVAYVHLSAQGSEEVVAALTAGAGDAAGQTLVIATESLAVATAWGLTQFNTAAHCSFARLVNAVVKAEPLTPQTLDAQPVAKVLTLATAAGAVRDVATHYGEALLTSAATATGADRAEPNNFVPKRLAAWRKAIELFNTSSPLRQLSTTSQVRHEFFAAQQAIKVIFFLRASDAVLFSQYHAVAVDLAQRVKRAVIPFKPSAAQSKGKQPQGYQAFVPPFRLEVYWVDAEQQPTFARHSYISKVPSIALYLPLLSKEQAAEQEKQLKEGGEGGGPDFADPNTIHGVHIINDYDLNVPDDGTGNNRPQSAKDLRPAFPKDVDQLLRFIAGPNFLQRAQAVMQSLPADNVEMEGETDTCEQLSNKRYLRLDSLYYPTSHEEAPEYVEGVLSGMYQLSPFNAEEYKKQQREAFAAESEKAGGAAAVENAKGETGGKDEKKLSAAAKRLEAQRAKWREELERREKEKRERIKEKAEKDAAARQEEMEKLKQEIKQELVETARKPKPFIVARPPAPSGDEKAREEAKKKHYQWQQQTWDAEAIRVGKLFAYPDKDGYAVRQSLE